MPEPRIVRIFAGPATGQDLTAYRSRLAIASKGLEGDRYALGTGFYSGVSEWDAHVTLIQMEPLEMLGQDHGGTLDPKTLRRNLVTRGIDLSSLIGREFRVGPEAVLRGRKLWPPCTHLVKQSGRPEIFKHLARDCGIGADILIGGLITLGDNIEL